MSLRLRFAIFLAAMTLLVVFGVWLSAGADSQGTESSRWQSSAQCRECHAEVYAEWEGSHHQIAYLNPEVRSLSDDFRNKECQACHLPRPVFHTGLGNRPLPRLGRPDEGVDCLTCHLAADGGILGRSDMPDAPCAPRHDDGFLSVQHCAVCHNQHQTTDQYEASLYPSRGETCNTCHMPEVRRPADRTGFSHIFPGAHDKDMLTRASRLQATVVDGELQMQLTNEEAGHNFPTEERHRAVDVMYRFVAADGSVPEEWTLARRFRQLYLDEGGENFQLPAGETWTQRVPIPDGSIRAQVRLWYRLQPYAVDGDKYSTLLFEEEVELR